MKVFKILASPNFNELKLQGSPENGISTYGVTFSHEGSKYQIMVKVENFTSDNFNFNFNTVEKICLLSVREDGKEFCRWERKEKEKCFLLDEPFLTDEMFQKMGGQTQLSA